MEVKYLNTKGNYGMQTAKVQTDQDLCVPL